MDADKMIKMWGITIMEIHFCRDPDARPAVHDRLD